VAVAAPSANRYGRISPTCADHVRADLGEKPGGLVDVILDGGASPLGIESTIVDCTGAAPRILRPGSIGREQLAAVLGAPVSVVADDAGVPRVSGRIAGHYAPRKPLELIVGGQLPARAAALHPLRVGALAPPALLAALPTSGPGSIAIHEEAADRPEDYARELYAQLRRLDASAADHLLVVAPPTTEPWDAVNDRLRRSAAGSTAPVAPPHREMR
jgi:L-threonylcarbamoyladenylate synthase